MHVRSNDSILTEGKQGSKSASKGKGKDPWYLLTNEPILQGADAWRIVFAYARRWQIEMSFRLGKSELAMESPRLWS